MFLVTVSPAKIQFLFQRTHTHTHAQANSEVSALLGRIPSAVGYQPTLATDLGGLQERITTTTKGSITSVQVRRGPLLYTQIHTPVLFLSVCVFYACIVCLCPGVGECAGGALPPPPRSQYLGAGACVHVWREGVL